MTNEEAKEIITTSDLFWSRPTDKECVALNMAIEALQAKTDGDTISRQDAIDAIQEAECMTVYADEISGLAKAEKILESLPSAEPTGDLISREEVLNMIIVAGECEPDLGYTHLHTVIESIPSATCDDCIWHVCNYNKIDWDGEDGYISKRDAMALVDRPIVPTGDAVYDNAREDERASIKDDLMSLPSAEPRKHIINDGTEVVIDEESYEIGYTHGQMAESKTGKWKLDPNGMDWNIPAWRCSECGFVATHIGVEPNGLGDSPLIWAGSKFCPQCGARITGYER